MARVNYGGNKAFQKIYDSIYNSMGTDDDLKRNIEAALRPLYEQSAEELQQQRIERNADIDVDAYSRGMGESTWVTDAKLRQLRGTESALADLQANYNNTLYGNLANAIKDRDADAYNQAMAMYQLRPRGGSGRGNGIDLEALKKSLLGQIPVEDPEKLKVTPFRKDNTRPQQNRAIYNPTFNKSLIPTERVNYTR